MGFGRSFISVFMFPYTVWYPFPRVQFFFFFLSDRDENCMREKQQAFDHKEIGDEVNWEKDSAFLVVLPWPQEARILGEVYCGIVISN